MERCVATPKTNVACLKLIRIAERKNEASEANLSGHHFKDLQQEEIPPCLQERAAFMSPHSFVREHSHPYRRNDTGTHAQFKKTPTHAHFKPTPTELSGVFGPRRAIQMDAERVTQWKRRFKTP